MEGRKTQVAVYYGCGTPLPKTAWLYCRVAHSAHSELEMQTAMLIDYAQKHGLEITGVTAETGSGLTLHRKGLNEVCYALETGKASILLIRNLCRIGRITVEVSNYLMWLKKHGIVLVCADGTNPYPYLEIIHCLSDRGNIR